MAKTRIWTAARLQELVNIMVGGASRKELAALFGVSQARISQLLKQGGVILPTRKYKVKPTEQTNAN